MSHELLVEYAALYKEHKDLDPTADCKVLEYGDWEQEGKHQYATHLVQYKDVLILVNESRSGSPFTDWYYEDSSLSLCERKEQVKVVVTYENIGNVIEVYRGD